VAVLRSRPRSESRISTEGFAASSARMLESWSWGVSKFCWRWYCRKLVERVMYVVEVADEFGVFV